MRHLKRWDGHRVFLKIVGIQDIETGKMVMDYDEDEEERHELSETH